MARHISKRPLGVQLALRRLDDIIARVEAWQARYDVLDPEDWVETAKGRLLRASTLINERNRP